jgi:hypothetical protein
VRSGPGEQLADLYRREGLKMREEHASHSTGGYGTEAGIAEMLVRMRSGRFKVAAHLSDWFDEFRGYHRKDGMIVKVNDDLMSATRIAVMDRRFAREEPITGNMFGGWRPPKPISTDFDVLTGHPFTSPWDGRHT